jgi:putative phage-type endonuclease
MSSVIGVTHCMSQKLISNCPQWVQELKGRELSGEQKSDEWLQQRSHMLTASNAGCALGDNPYTSRNAFINQKCVDPTGVNSFAGNSSTMWGEHWEQAALQKYCDLYHKDVYAFNLIKHKEFDWMGGSPDGITHDGILIEIKCPKARRIKPNSVGAIPIYYIDQVQMLMHICELDQCHFVQYKPYDGEFSPELFDVISIPKDPDWWVNGYPILQSTWGIIVDRRQKLANGEALEVLDDPNSAKRAKTQQVEKFSSNQTMQCLFVK